MSGKRKGKKRIPLMSRCGLAGTEVIGGAGIHRGLAWEKSGTLTESATERPMAVHLA